ARRCAGASDPGQARSTRPVEITGPTMFNRAKTPTLRCADSWALLALALLITSGCQTAHDRPLLPLLEAVEEQALVARLGTPTIVLTQATQKPAPVEVMPAVSAAVPPALFAQEAPIDLDGALQRASFANPRISLADELVRASVAERMLLRSFYLPTLNA